MLSYKQMVNMEKILTIVVPVYKVEQYINKCLDSCILYKADGSVDEELMSLMEVLIINDGTPDNSAELSREYTVRFPQTFIQIDKENGGHGSVWNLGVKLAKGKYIKFLDSDDWLENLDKMIRKLQQTNSDLITTSCICHCPGNVLWKLHILDMEFDKVYDTDKFDWIGNRSHGNYVFHHCAIYKAALFRQYLPLFLEKQPYDDMILCAAPIVGAKTFEAWDLEVYHYLMDREGQSISLEVRLKNINAQIKTRQYTIEWLLKHFEDIPGDSLKLPFFKKRLSNMLSYGYKSLLTEIPYQQSKCLSKDWENWLKKVQPQYSNLWLKLYRMMPFACYWLLYRTAVKVYCMIKK